MQQENDGLRQALGLRDEQYEQVDKSVAPTTNLGWVPPVESTIHPAVLQTNEGLGDTSGNPSALRSSFLSSPQSEIHPVGQLSIDAAGGSRFYGPTAAAHVLPDSDKEDGDREATPQGETMDPSALLAQPSVAFPFVTPSLAAKRDVLQQAYACLPSPDRLQRWRDIYWEASFWRHGALSTEQLDTIIYEVQSRDGADDTPAGKLAVVYGVLAFACLFDDSLPPHSSQAQHFNTLSLTCLSVGDFLVNTSVASL